MLTTINDTSDIEQQKTEEQQWNELLTNSLFQPKLDNLRLVSSFMRSTIRQADNREVIMMGRIYKDVTPINHLSIRITREDSDSDNNRCCISSRMKCCIDRNTLANGLLISSFVTGWAVCLVGAGLWAGCNDPSRYLCSDSVLAAGRVCFGVGAFVGCSTSCIIGALVRNII